MSPICRLTGLLLWSSAALLAPAGGVQAAQSYDSCAGFIDSIPATITTQGTWCLRKDLSTAITSGNAITIAANNVTIDCNDFKLGGLAAGNASQAYGVYAYNRQNATIRHCNVRGFFIGINLEDGYFGSAGHLVEDNRLDNNLYCGISAFGSNNRVRRNAVYDTGGAPLQISAVGIRAGADIEDNIVSYVFAMGTDTYPRGIDARASGTIIRGNRVSGLVVSGSGNAYGVEGGFRSRIADNHIASSSGIAAGSGIHSSSNSKTVCSGNTIVGFATALSNCFDAGGNASL